MENRYNVLWFDDYFAAPTIDSSEDVIDRHNNMVEYAEIASEDYGLECRGVSTYDGFEKELDNAHNYQALILDLRGLDPNDSLNDNIAYRAALKACNTPNLLIFVFSQNIHDGKFDGLREVLSDAEFLPKAGRPQAEALFAKIKDALDRKLQYYKGHEECLLLFNERILQSDDNKKHMDKILSKFMDEDRTYAPYNPMRQILEEMLAKLVSIGTIPNNREDDKIETFNKLIFHLAEECPKDKDGKYDHEHPIIPFEVCPREIKYLLCFLRDITNKYSHFLDKYNIEIAEYDTLGCNLLIQQSTYNAFFAVMKWFYAYYRSRRSQMLGPFEISYDKYNDVYLCGEYLIAPNLITSGTYALGEKAYVIDTQPNTSSKSKHLYPTYAKIVKE